MQRIQAPGNVAAMPARFVREQAPGYFSAGDPANGQQATVVTAEWCNAVQEEIVTVIEGAGFAPDADDFGQLLPAVRKIAGDLANAVKVVDSLDDAGGASIVFLRYDA